MLVEILTSCVLFAPPQASAGEAVDTHEPIAHEAIELPSRLEVPRRARVADPWFTRAAVRVMAAQTTGSATMPDSSTTLATTRETSQGGALSIDLYGRRFGFDLALSGSADALAAPAPSASPSGTPAAVSRSASGEATFGMTAAVVQTRGLFVGAGPGVEARATISGSTGGGGSTSGRGWQTVVAGADVRARVFVGPHLFLSANGFVGAIPVAGSWQMLDPNTSNGTASGSLSKPRVLAGSVAASLRPVEWMAFSGGIAMRDATYTLDDGSHAAERALRPFAGIELLY